MRLKIKSISALFCASLSIPFVLMSCSSGSESDVSDLTDVSESVLVTGSTAETLSENAASEETTRAAEQSDNPGFAPSELNASTVTAGYVTLEWEPSAGDTNHQHPGGDAVSYYQVFRDGEPLTDSFSPFIEDTQAPSGEVTYSVRAVKFETSSDFLISYSTITDTTVQVPSVEDEAALLGGQKISDASFTQSLNNFQSCATAYAEPDNEMLCVNHLGYAWSVSESGDVADLTDHTRAVGGDLYVLVRNRDAEFGPIPDVPTWTTTQLSTNETIQRELILTTPQISDEQYLVNGVAVGDDNAVYISGTLFQSYLPRSLGPGPGVLPVTTAYFVAQMDVASGEMIHFQRYPLTVAPGALATVTQGELVLFQTGKVTFMDASTLTVSSSIAVSGNPEFADETFVYTSVVASTNGPYNNLEYYRFER